MSGIVDRLGALFPKTIGSYSGRKSSGRRRFLPQHIALLEQRAVPSTFLATPSVGTNTPSRATDSVPRPASTSHVTELHNVAFPTTGGQSELLDVYMPTGPAPAGGSPVIVAIHGGGWRRISKDGYGSRVADAFVPDGYVVIAPNYTLSAPDRPSWPENLDDVQAAVRWVRSNAQALGVNSNEIAAMGESAGANLAALLGVYSTQNSGPGVSAAVDAVVASSTPTDLTSLYYESHLAGLAAAQMLGGSPEQLPASYTAASPALQVSPGDPPMLLIQGRQDPLIPVSQSEELQAALTAAGVRNQLILVDGGHKLDFPPNYPELVPAVLDFLDLTWNDANATSS